MNKNIKFIKNIITKELKELWQSNFYLQLGVLFFSLFILMNIIKITNITLKNITSWLFLLSSLILIIIGLIITIRTFKKKRFFYLIGLENQSTNPPFEGLPKLSQWVKPKVVVLSINTKDFYKMKEKLKSHLEMISKEVKQGTEPYRNEIFFAGLARVPYLYFIGYGFRNAYGSIILLDHDHKKSSWFTLKDIDDNDIDLKIKNEEEIKPNDKGDIGIAIEFTSEILETELPDSLKEHTIRVRLTTGFSYNQITRQTTLARIVDKIIMLLVKVNKKANTDTIHLFISAQSTLVFSLGSRYQDGMIGNIAVYSYDAQHKKYTWAFKMENGEIKFIKAK